MSSAEPARKSARAPRERAYLAASIAYNNGALTLPCTVMQISATGARISVPAEANLPESFQIAIPQKSLERRARLVWRRGDTAGLAFAPLADAAEEPDDDPAVRIKALTAENERLRAQVGKLTAQIARLTND